MPVEIKEIYPAVKLGEGPHWCPEDQALVFVDILSGNLHRYFSKTGRRQVLHIG